MQDELLQRQNCIEKYTFGIKHVDEREMNIAY